MDSFKQYNSPRMYGTSSQNSGNMSHRDGKVDSSRNVDKHKQILMVSVKLIEDHLGFNDELFERLKVLRVLPQTMITDVQIADAENRVEVLIDLVSKMGAKGFYRLCDAMDQSGNSMVGHHLRDQAYSEVQEKSEFVKMVDEYYPQLKRIFTPVELTSFSNNLHDKVNDVVARRMWAMQSKEKRRLSAERKVLISDDIRMFNRVKNKDEEISSLRQTILHKEKQNESLQNKIKDYEHAILAVKARHKEEQNSLVKSNEAAERTIVYTQERLATFDGQIKSLNIRISELLSPDRSESIRKDKDNIRVSRLEVNISRLITHIQKVEKQLRLQIQKRNEQRKLFFNTVNIEDKQQDFTTAFHQSLTEMHSSLQPLTQQIDLLVEVLQQKDLITTKNKTQSKLNTLSIPKHSGSLLKSGAGFGIDANNRVIKMKKIMQESELKCRNATDQVVELKRQFLDRDLKMRSLRNESNVLKMNKRPMVSLKNNIAKSVSSVLDNPTNSIISNGSPRNKLKVADEYKNKVQLGTRSASNAMSDKIEVYKNMDVSSNTAKGDDIIASDDLKFLTDEHRTISSQIKGKFQENPQDPDTSPTVQSQYSISPSNLSASMPVVPQIIEHPGSSIEGSTDGSKTNAPLSSNTRRRNLSTSSIDSLDREDNIPFQSPAVPQRKRSNGLSAYLPIEEEEGSNRRRKYSIIMPPETGVLTPSKNSRPRRSSKTSVVSIASEELDAGFQRVTMSRRGSEDVPIKA